MKRGTSGINMLIAVDKPSGATSHDVVNTCRRAFNERRVGHMGTLDPLATGVMLVGIGSFTRLNRFLENHDKTYVVTAVFGKATNTYDAEGEVTQTAPVPAKFADEDFAREAVQGMIGKQLQKPPVFSAIKINGKPAYKAARKGQDVEIPVREIEVYDAKLLEVQDSSWVIELSVSKGTYIRSLVHDLGQRLGVPAYVKGLRRTKLGSVSLDECIEFDALQSNCDAENLEKLDPVRVLGFDVVHADKRIQTAVSNGNQFNINADKQYNIGQNVCVIIGEKTRAIYQCVEVHDSKARFKAKVVFN